MENLSIDPIKFRLQIISDNWEQKGGKCILYVMSRDQRVADNHALLAAQQQAIKNNVPLAVIFVLNTISKHRAQEQYRFMVDGLSEVEANLASLNIPFIMLIGKPVDKLLATIKHYQPITVYMDFNPLRGSRAVANTIAKHVPVVVVDTHNIVPVWVASNKQEYSARTIRPKIHSQLSIYTVEPLKITKHPHAWPGTYMTMAQLANQIAESLATIEPNKIIINFTPGESAAISHVQHFINNGLKGYASARNDPSKDALSNLSPYLHFGQISSLRVLLELQQALQLDASIQPDYDVLIEEMIIRKELSDNFCNYNNQYDLLTGAPAWAQATLAKHSIDRREFLYSIKQFEMAQTHDQAWNSAQRQLTISGKMHGYMRMYWAKKVLEWSKTPQAALDTLIYLNDFYSIDGGDPNGYVGILWSIAGLHDRPWGEREIYGSVRCMVFSGLKRKFDIQTYIDYY